jgi:hypothetical protein
MLSQGVKNAVSGELYRYMVAVSVRAGNTPVFEVGLTQKSGGTK